MEEVFSVKLQTENACFCLRSKLNKTQPTQIRTAIQSSSTFVKISGSISEVKEIWIGQ